jgi:hypothetical protein
VGVRTRQSRTRRESAGGIDPWWPNTRLAFDHPGNITDILVDPYEERLEGIAFPPCREQPTLEPVALDLIGAVQEFVKTAAPEYVPVHRTTRTDK